MNFENKNINKKSEGINLVVTIFVFYYIYTDVSTAYKKENFAKSDAVSVKKYEKYLIKTGLQSFYIKTRGN